MAEKRVIELEVKTDLPNMTRQLRDAQREVAALSEKFGATSQEAVNAAKKAAELKDAIGDAKALTDAFNPDAKFNALTASISGVLNGFQAFEGAMGLVGVESKAVEETLLKVQSAMALSQGVQGLLEAKDSFMQLKAVIGQTAIVQKALNFVMKANPVFLVIGAVTALAGAYFAYTKIVDTNTAALEENRKKEQELLKIRNAEIKRFEKIIDNEQEIAKARKGGLFDLQRELKLLESKGASEKEIFEKKKQLIKEEIALINYAVARRRQTRVLDGEEKIYRDEYQARKNFLNDLEVLENEFNNRKKDTKKKEKKEEQEDEQAWWEIQAEALRKFNEDWNNATAEGKRNAIEQEQDFNNQIEGLAEQNYQSKLTDKDNELLLVQDKYFNLETLAEGNASQLAIIEEAKGNEIDAIQQKYADQEKKRKEQLQEQAYNVTSNGLQSIASLVDAFAGKSARQQKKAFETQKKLNIALAVVDTAKGAVSAYNSASAYPYPANLILGALGAAAVVGAGVAQIQKIRSTSFDGGGSVGSSPSATLPTNVSTGANAPNFNQIGNITQQQQFNFQPIQAFVVSGEVTSQQALDRNRLKNATFG